MNKVELIQVDHNFKIGDICPYTIPNIVDDTIFYLNDKPVGFYLSKLPDYASNLANIADNELKSKNVPKAQMVRSANVMKGYSENGKRGTENLVEQMSCILGSVPPRPHMRRPYPSISSVHSVKSAQTFIKAMIMLAKESEKIIADLLPEQYMQQKNILSDVAEKWRFANLFTSSISNYNISAPYHRDTGNLQGTVNAIICKKYNSQGGDLNIPDFGATIGQRDNSILVYPVWQNVHGVTPITPIKEGGYRNSLVFYPLKAFKGI
jgi:hypothetical protein